jgi:hypothetical protein
VPEASVTEADQPVPADDAGLVKERIAGYRAADARLREVAKWFATSAAALTAVLVGTSPLSGLTRLGWGREIMPPLLFGAAALAALGVVVYMASQVLAPSTVEFADVMSSADFAGFRRKIATDPHPYLGTWADDVPGFAYERTHQHKAFRSIEQKLADPATPPEDVAALEPAKDRVVARLRRTGWVTQRLLAAAENDLLWRRFQRARLVTAVAVAVAAAGVVGFLVSVQRGAAVDEIDGPLPVRVSLTEAGRVDLASLLGPTCPTESFEALLTAGGQEAPWEIIVTDPSCTRGGLTLGGTEGRVLFVPPGG